ncbi:hypothetical protein HXX76_011588 [Chlamydomonas incerta]|uniref:Uncharacterized protein n=1 Tax=Chlamydomonas incerta TaxID=51695 RepID=A0A835SK25_CHLIN|nr:hypothetical protein HXX76_011588 [Chlamydomonas incerta]|eukprot:KAG2428469.1 hypothetical protein HXX76_011588 [Chlamydomonas incerta]
MVEGACTTNDNLVDLRNRAADLLDIIIDRKEALLEKQLYVNIIARFDDLLQEIIKYAEDYTTRNWVVRVLTSTNDGTHYEELQQHLRELTVEAHFAITVDVHSMTVEVRDMLQALEASQARYMDHGARLRELIASNGGMTQVLASPDKLDMVLEQMGPTEKLTIAFMQQAVSSLQASQDEGVHLLIEQPSMRVFWRKLFRHKWRIPWDRFWSVFPGQLRLADVPANEVQQIEEFLRRAEQKLAFQASVEKNDPGYVSVDEITTSFPGDAPLVHSVKQLTAGNAVALGSDSSTGASGASTTVQLVQPPRCNLPELDELYCGRESAAAALANDLAGGLPEVVCITADPGYGKSSFAVDVGRRLWLAGAASGGTILVDMRKVHSKREVDAAFCAALSIDQDPTDSTARIVARVKALAYSSTAPAAVVMVIDNAEDPLNSAGSSHLLAVLAKVQDAVPIARLLVTSRSPFPEEVAGGGSSTGEQLEQQRPKVRHHQLGALQPAAAEQDVRIASDAAAAANSDSLVAVMLSALPKRQLTALAQMALFPTIFSASGAEAAMACDAPKAKALLMVHLQHGFVRFDSREAVYSLHPRVQQGLASIPVKVDLQATREAVALHCVDNLGLWAKLYSTGEASAHALHKGRQHQADIVQLLQLLGDQDAKPSLRVVQALALVAKPAALGRYLYPLGIMGLPAMVKAWENASRLLKEMGDEVLYSSSISMLAWSLRTANYYGSASEHGSSEELFREALEIRTRVLGPDHVDTLVSLSALGSSLQMQGRSAEAEPIFRDVLEKRRKITDADVTEAMANLAWTLQSLNR